MVKKSIFGFSINEGEQIIFETKRSNMVIVVSWLSVPMIFVVYFLFSVLPGIIRRSIRNAVVGVVADGIGLEEITKEIPAGSSGVPDQMFDSIKTAVYLLAAISIALLVLAWLGWCLYQTYKYQHFQYGIALTDFRVIGKAGDDVLSIQFSALKNIYVERSVWGRLFKYGSVIIQTDRRSVIFKNIHDPMHICSLLLPYVERIY